MRILRDTVLWKMTDEDWEQVLAIHAGGTFKVHASCGSVLPRKQNFGRIVNVTSYTGLHGNTGQANYATAKVASSDSPRRRPRNSRGSASP